MGGTGVHWECRNGRPSCCLRDLQRDYSTGSSEVSIVERVNGCERPNGAVSSSELSCWRRSESVLRVLVFTMPRERSNGFKTEGNASSSLGRRSFLNCTEILLLLRYTRDFPKPMGTLKKTSLPLRRLSTASNCSVLILSYPSLRSPWSTAL